MESVTRDMPSGADQPRVVTVLGMHRSATSSLTRVLDLLGVHLGDPDAFIPPAPDNPRGFFENRPLVLVNERLLSLLGGRWDAPPQLGPDWRNLSTLRALAGPAGEVFDRLLHGLVPSGAVVGWKDPRTCLLLPFWESVLSARTHDHRHVHVVRRPDEVVASLARRDGLSTEHAARLWVRYVGDALTNAPDALVVEQSRLFDDPMGTVDALCDHVGLDAPSDDVRSAVLAHLDRGLLRQSGSRCADGPWMELARDVFGDLRAGLPPLPLGRRARSAAHEIRAAQREWQLLVLGPLTAAEPLRRLPATGAGAAIVVPEGTPPNVRYGWESDGWGVFASPPEVLVRDLRPDVVLASDDRSVREAIDALIAHDPSTRLATTRGSRLGAVVDDEIDLASENVLIDVERLVTAGRHRVRGPRVGTVPHSTTRSGVVSVVVPVHGNWVLTAACLDALATHTSRELEVVVVDDASPDDTRLELRSRADVTHVVELDDNVGFAAAVNHGLRATSGEFVCVLNNDTEVTSGWLESMLAALAIPDTGLVGPRSNSVSGPQQIASAPSFTELSTTALHRWAHSWAADRPDVTWQTSRLVGFCLLTRRRVLEELGGFDEAVGRGNYEDDELCSRVRDAGLACRVAERAVVLHHGSATFGQDPLGYLRALLEGARHTFGRLRRDAPVTTTIVLADDDLPTAIRTAVAALPITEAAEVWHTTSDVPADLLPRVTIRRLDWRDDAAVALAARDLASPRLLVLGAGETLAIEDPVAARVELELGAADGLGTGEVRLVPNSPAGIARVGAPASCALTSVRISSLSVVG